MFIRRRNLLLMLEALQENKGGKIVTAMMNMTKAFTKVLIGDLYLFFQKKLK